MDDLATDSRFTYEPLNQRRDDLRDNIRVVRVLPALSLVADLGEGFDNSLIQCEMRTVPLEDTHRCLSYCWGSQEHLNPIVLNGRLFYVHDNLYRFLIEAQKHLFDQWFWIDAISIDQKNTNERNHQVKRMSQIYRQAERVYVWLDPVPTTTSSALQTDLMDYLRYSFPRPSQVEELLMWSTFLSNDYFDRLWIVVEMRLAKNLFIWHSNMMRPHAEVWDLLNPQKRILQPDMEAISFRIKGRLSLLRPSQLPRTYKGGSVTMYNLIKELEGLLCECADPRDRIYGLLGIASHMITFDVDYSEHILGLYRRLLFHCGEWQDVVPSDQPQVFASFLRLDKQQVRDYLRDSKPSLNLYPVSYLGDSFPTVMSFVKSHSQMT